MKPHVVQYRRNGQWLNFYCRAKSIADAEVQALVHGIRGEAFEIVESGVFSHAT